MKLLITCMHIKSERATNRLDTRKGNMTIKQYSKKAGGLHSRFATLLAVTVIGGGMLVSGVASADAATTTPSVTNGTTITSTTTTTGTAGATSNTRTSTGATKAASVAANQQARLQLIISKGNQEIERRLATLSTLTNKVNSATKLSASDKTTLSDEVSSTISGLTSLKVTLDADNTTTAAITDAQSIYTEYRVYALVAPKVNLIKVADDQQVVEGNLTTLSQKLQTRISADQTAGKDVTTMQGELADMQSRATAAQAISSNIESTVINIQPSDYNSNHSVLTGDNTQLKTAHNDDMASVTDAKDIAAALKSLE
jgi:hypothetical protein